MNYNESKIFESNFLGRFLAFAESFDKLNYMCLLPTAQKWVDDRNYDYIRYYLRYTPYESMLPISATEFVFMDYTTFQLKQAEIAKLLAFYDEKKSLYEELLEYTIPE